MLALQKAFSSLSQTIGAGANLTNSQEPVSSGSGLGEADEVFDELSVGATTYSDENAGYFVHEVESHSGFRYTRGKARILLNFHGRVEKTQGKKVVDIDLDLKLVTEDGNEQVFSIVTENHPGTDTESYILQVDLDALSSFYNALNESAGYERQVNLHGQLMLVVNKDRFKFEGTDVYWLSSQYRYSFEAMTIDYDRDQDKVDEFLIKGLITDRDQADQVVGQIITEVTEDPNGGRIHFFKIEYNEEGL